MPEPPLKFPPGILTAPRAFRFTLPKPVIPVMAAPAVDEPSLMFIANMKKRADAEAQKRADAEAHIRALVEAQERAEAEAQKLAQPLPLTAEEESQMWKAFIISENARKLDLEDRQKHEDQAQEEREKQAERTEQALKIDAEKKLISAMHQKEFISRHTDVKHVAHVAPVAPVAQVAEVAPVKHARTRHFNVVRLHQSL